MEKKLSQEKAKEIYDHFILESVNGLLDNCNIFETIRSFKKIVFEWQNPDYKTECKMDVLLLDCHFIETLLIDIAEAKSETSYIREN